MRNKLYFITLFIYFPLFFCLIVIAKDNTVFSGSLDDRQEINSIIIIGDTQRAGFLEVGREKNDAARPVILKKAATENPAFIIHLGDFVFWGSSKKDWNTFENYSSEIRKNNIPVFPVLGNHEYFGSNEKSLKNIFSRFPHLKNSQWYSFKFKKTGFIFLNSNFDELSVSEKEKQNKWYLKKLNELQDDSSIKMIIICCHHAPYTNSTIVSDNEDVQKYFVQQMLKIPKAKLFFTGHCHSYEHFIKNNKHFVVTGGGSGPRQKLKIDSSEAKHQDTYKGGEIRNFNFCKVTFKEDGLLVQMISIDDNLTKWNLGQEFFVKNN